MDSEVGFCMLSLFACTSHAVSPRPALVKLLYCDTVCHRYFLLLDRMRVLSPVFREGFLS